MFHDRHQTLHPLSFVPGDGCRGDQQVLKKSMLVVGRYVEDPSLPCTPPRGLKPHLPRWGFFLRARSGRADYGAGAMKFQSLAHGPVASVKRIPVAGPAT